MISQVNEIKENIKIFLDDKAFIMKRYSKTTSLSSIREDLTSKRKFNFVFAMKDGFQIEKGEEDEFTLIDILNGNELFLKSVKDDVTDEKTTEKPKKDENKNIINEQIVTNNEEKKNIESIDNNQIQNNPPAETPKIVGNPEKQNKINIDIKNEDLKEDKITEINMGEKNTINITPSEGITELLKLKVYVNGNHQFDCEFDKNWNLIKARKKLFNFLKNDFLFLLPDGFVINHEEEEIFSVEGIINENKIYINQEKLILKLNSKHINNNDNQEIYIKKNKNNIINNIDNNFDKNPSKNQIKSESSNAHKNQKINDIYENNNDKQKMKMNNNINYNQNNYDNANNQNAYRNMQLNKLKSQSTKLENIGNLEIYLYPRYNFDFMQRQKSINFMVVGQTGSGKTTLLNAFLNYLLGIKFEDNFRFKLIHEDFGISMAESQTRDVILYNIIPFDKNIPLITVIDTPGFGDTGGLEKDKLIADKIAEKFRNEVSHINAICFVAQSTNAKLTVNQKYIFNSIMDLFSDDIKENFVAMLTFCNIIDENPVVLEPLKKKGSGFDLVLPAIEKSQWYFLFDNLAIFKSKENEKLNRKIKSFYGFAMENFDEFMSKLLSLPKKTLTNTKRVLDDRKSLEAKIQVLEEIVKFCLNKIDEFIQTYNIVNRYYDELKNENFRYKVKEIHTKKVPTSTYNGDGGKYFTTCLICSHTCHKGCWIENNAEKSRCSAMDQTLGTCRVCKGKCAWNMHENRDWIWEEYEEEVTKTDEFLKAKYVKKKSEKSAKEQILDGLEQEISKMNIELMQTQEEMKNTINELKKIALNKDVFDSAEQHIDLLIENEKYERKPGWQKRIEAFNILKRQKIRLKEIYHGQHNDANKIQSFVKKFNREEIRKHSDGCFIF